MASKAHEERGRRSLDAHLREFLSGFYNPQKYAVAPAALPEKLHCLKWEAYSTWPDHGANGFFVIIRGQKKRVAAMRAGQVPDPIYGQRSKQRSVHHNYFTLPVLFIMISNHDTSTYAQQHGWAGLALIPVAAVSIRHFSIARTRV